MDSFELVSSVADLLRGKDAEVWRAILERTLKNEDPYTVRIPQVPILDVNWHDGVDPENIITDLQSKERMEIDHRIIAAFEREKKGNNFSAHKALRIHNGQVMIQFDPQAFGVGYDFYQQSSFGADAKIGYTKVVEAALKYGFKQPDLVSALYFRARFLDAHSYTEGTAYYIGCKPIVYADDQLPIIPVFDYDRYRGWSINAQEIGPDTLLGMNFGAGQGECFRSTFVFALPRQY